MYYHRTPIDRKQGPDKRLPLLDLRFSPTLVTRRIYLLDWMDVVG
jgi:hypothetical protein